MIAFTPGQRIQYTSRTTGQELTGTIIDFYTDGGCQVQLDVGGGIKELFKEDMNRVAPIGAMLPTPVAIFSDSEVPGNGLAVPEAVPIYTQGLNSGAPSALPTYTHDLDAFGSWPATLPILPIQTQDVNGDGRSNGAGMSTGPVPIPIYTQELPGSVKPFPGNAPEPVPIYTQPLSDDRTTSGAQVFPIYTQEISTSATLAEPVAIPIYTQDVNVRERQLSPAPMAVNGGAQVFPIYTKDISTSATLAEPVAIPIYTQEVNVREMQRSPAPMSVNVPGGNAGARLAAPAAVHSGGLARAPSNGAMSAATPRPPLAEPIHTAGLARAQSTGAIFASSPRPPASAPLTARRQLSVGAPAPVTSLYRNSAPSTYASTGQLVNSYCPLPVAGTLPVPSSKPAPVVPPLKQPYSLTLPQARSFGGYFAAPVALPLKQLSPQAMRGVLSVSPVRRPTPHLLGAPPPRKFDGLGFSGAPPPRAEAIGSPGSHLLGTAPIKASEGLGSAGALPPKPDAVASPRSLPAEAKKVTKLKKSAAKKRQRGGCC
eukprot:TRINITY_DN15498_c0_g1_i1.p1 TRINITY_DN15498_c0_g1~~TRINITY_DN15498_c0_g1_i1.p1  ORF type:complete len:541 (-),score=32.38 TRINITY_DN15498_c0_g1_i1:97-1719(-)